MASERKCVLAPPEGEFTATVYLELRASKGDLIATVIQGLFRSLAPCGPEDLTRANTLRTGCRRAACVRTAHTVPRGLFV